MPISVLVPESARGPDNAGQAGYFTICCHKLRGCSVASVMADAGLRRRSAAELIAGRLAASGLAAPAADLVRAALASAWPGGLGGPDDSGGTEDSGGPDGSGGAEDSGGRGEERPGA